MTLEVPCEYTMSEPVHKDEDEEKVLQKVKMKGYTARIFQHEYDHMEGLDFTQRV